MQGKAIQDKDTIGSDKTHLKVPPSKSLLIVRELAGLL